jgi:hypothetical protein
VLQYWPWSSGYVLGWDCNYFRLAIIESSEPDSAVIVHIAFEFHAGEYDNTYSIIDGDNLALLEHDLPDLPRQM